LRSVAITRRPGIVGAITSGPVAVFAETFATRRVGSLLATIVTGRVGPLVAEFLLLEACRRSGFAALALRRTVIAIVFRAIAARRGRALVALTLAGETAFGEFLLRSTRCARAALGAGGPIAPAVVFIVIAGH